MFSVRSATSAAHRVPSHAGPKPEGEIAVRITGLLTSRT